MTTWFGSTNASSGNQTLSTDQPRGAVFAAPASGNITAAHVKMGPPSGSGHKVKVLVYAQSAGAPGALLGQSDEYVMPAGAVDVKTLTFSTPVAVTSGTNYYLMIFCGVASITVQGFASGTSYNRSSGVTYPTPPNPYGSGSTFTMTYYLECGIDPPAAPAATGNFLGFT